MKGEINFKAARAKPIRREEMYARGVMSASNYRNGIAGERRSAVSFAIGVPDNVPTRIASRTHEEGGGSRG